MKNEKYSTFFSPEIKDFLETSQKSKIEAMMTDDFLEKRQIGENHSYICEIIRNDSIDQFITHITQTDLPLSYEIEDSIFETNSFLIGNKPQLIEYAAYFGAIRIFEYLQTNDVILKESVWLYAIHSKNSEILQILEDNDVKPQEKIAVELFNESIACHYNDIARYIYDNYINNQNDENNNENNDDNNNDNNDNNTNILPAIYFKSYNFAYIETEFIDYSNFIDLCEYDYTFFVDRLMKTITPDDLNKKVFKKYDGEENEYESTALFAAVKNDNNEVVKMLLSNDDINVNFIYRKCINLFSDEITVILILLMFFLLIPIITLLFIKYFPTISSILLKFELTIIILMIYLMTLFIYPSGLGSIRSILSISPISLEPIVLKNCECMVLNLACYNNNAEIVNLLLSKKDIDVNAKYKSYDWSTHEDTALTIALKNDNNEIVKKLVSNPNIDVNIANKYHVLRFIPASIYLLITCSFLFTLLSIHFPTVSNKTSNVILLIGGCLFFYQNRHQILPMIKYFVTLWSIEFIFQFIIELISSRSFDHILIRVFKACFSTRKIKINFNYGLLSNIANIFIIFSIINMLPSLFYTEYSEKPPLHIAIENKNIENAKLLLENKNIDVNSAYKSCVYNFKDKTIDINNYDFKSFDTYEQEFTYKTALNMAAEMDNAEIVELLLSFKNIDVNAKCKLTVHKRIQFIYFLSLSLYAVESIICSLFGRRSNKSTLDIAIENSNVEIVKKLLENSKIKNVKVELKKLKQRQLENDSSPNKVNEQVNNENENESNETKNRAKEISELLQKFISESQLKQ